MRTPAPAGVFLSQLSLMSLLPPSVFPAIPKVVRNEPEVDMQGVVYTALADMVIE